MDCDRIIKEMYNRMIDLCDENIKEKFIDKLACLEYVVYNNIMLIISAYLARKRKFDELSEILVQKSNNVLYRAMWERWKEDRYYK